MLDRRKFIGAIGGASLAWPTAARSQTARKIARIGIVSIGGPTADMTGPLPRNTTVRAFLRGMAELGYIYGRNFVTEPRGTDAISSIIELTNLKVDVIVATGGGAALSSLKQATNTIPIVMTAAPDPLKQAYVRSLAHRKQFYRDEFAKPRTHG